MTALKVGAVIAVLVYLDRRAHASSSKCKGAENGTPCGPDSICHTGDGYSGACLKRGRYEAGTTVGGSVPDPFGWLSPETWGTIDNWFERAGDFVDGMVPENEDQQQRADGPIVSTNDPRL